MTTTKKDLTRQAEHLNMLLKDLGVDIGLAVEYAYGQPMLSAKDGSQIMSMRQSKPDLEATFYAIRSILYEVGRVQRQEKRG